MPASQTNSYDDIPYATKPLFYSHPDLLATKATIFGMTPARVDRCRVLELGCAQGGNLIAMAQALPESRFVGVDLSEVQVANARAAAQKLGLHNVDIRVQSILNLDESLGEFDYIICHGVYSWVPAEVRDHILTVCKRNLALQGVAYVSYNIYPGWRLRGIMRELLEFHVRHLSKPRERMHEARACIGRFAEMLEGADDLFGRLLAKEVHHLRSSADSYVYHDHLEDTNEPVYFHQFMERAAAKGLQYLDEAQSAPPEALSRRIGDTLRELTADVIAREQYADFVRGRSFRCTLLCHDTVGLRRPPLPTAVECMHVVTKLRPTAPVWDPSPDAVREFATAMGATMSTNNLVLGKALYALVQSWPRAIPFHDLWTQVRAECPGVAATDSAQLAAPLLECFLADVIELHVHPPVFAMQVSEWPRASGIARLQAENSDRVTNLRNYFVDLDPLDRFVLGRLDGKHSRAMLVAALERAIDSGQLVIHQENRPRGEKNARRQMLDEALTLCLRKLAGNALLVA